MLNLLPQKEFNMKKIEFYEIFVKYPKYDLMPTGIIFSNVAEANKLCNKNNANSVNGVIYCSQKITKTFYESYEDTLTHSAEKTCN